MEPSMRLIPTQARLIEFDEPVFVRYMGEKQESEDVGNFNKKVEDEMKGLELKHAPGCPDPKSQQHSELQEVLNTIIKPIEWVDDGKMWRQKVCDEEVSREDVLDLATTLDKRLKLRNANLKGICPIRRELYKEFFDELIRQVAVMCPERGVLLMRVRDELQMTIDAYETIYEGCRYFKSKLVNVPKRAQPQATSRKVLPDEETNEYENTVDETSGEEVEDDEKVVELTEVQERAAKYERMNDKNEALKSMIRDIKSGLELKEMHWQELINAEENWFNREKEHLIKVKAQMEEQLKLFKAPNPHGEVATESILDQFIKHGTKNPPQK